VSKLQSSNLSSLLNTSNTKPCQQGERMFKEGDLDFHFKIVFGSGNQFIDPAFYVKKLYY